MAATATIHLRRPCLTRPGDDSDALLHDPTTTIGVVGAGDDPTRHGGRIYRSPKAEGFRVLAVNRGAQR